MPKPISVFIFWRGLQWAESNECVIGDLITGHYEGDMLLWLLFNITSASTCENSGVSSHSALWNQSHASSSYKNKQLDFQSTIWDFSFPFFYFLVLNVSFALLLSMSGSTLRLYRYCFSRSVLHLYTFASSNLFWKTFSFLIILLGISNNSVLRSVREKNKKEK